MDKNKDVFVVEGKRTPFGSFGGVLSEIPSTELGATAIKGVLFASGVSASDVDEVITGQVLSGGVGQAPARQAMRGAGIPDSAAALTVNKVCGSGLKAIMLGADSIRLGNSSIVIAGGMENMSMAPYFLKKARNGYRMGNGEIIDLMVYDGLTDPYTGVHMGDIGERSAAEFGVGRQEQDDFAIRSFKLSQDAIKAGVFKDEIVPVIKNSRGAETIISEDEEPFKVNFDKITSLKTVFKKDGTITAANASSISDGAAMLLLADNDAVIKHNLSPKARMVAYATESRHPDHFPDAPIGAIKKACAKAGLSIADIDLFEINEAFALVTILAIKELHIPVEKVNVNGGACAIGHPIGASGARLAATVVRELGRQNKRFGLATLCIGGGEAVAVIFEKL